MLIMMKTKLKNYWSEHNLASIDLNVLRESRILTPENSIRISTKFGAIDSNIAKTKPLFKEILSLGVSLLLEKLKCTNEDNHIDYINAILALVERQSGSASMNKSFVNENSFSFYG